MLYINANSSLLKSTYDGIYGHCFKRNTENHFYITLPLFGVIREMYFNCGV